MKSRKNLRRRTRRILKCEPLESRNLLAADFGLRHNFVEPADVNDDGEVSPSDALAIVNELNATGDRGPDQLMFADVNDDGQVAPIDCLFVINHLNDAGIEFGGLAEIGEVDFRTIDGTGNNLLDTSQGAAGTNLIRFGYPAVYPDGHGDEIASDVQPNARDVSNSINAQVESVLNDRQLTDWVVQWGQFITHDFALTENAAANNVLSDGSTGNFEIAVTDPNDPLGPNSIPFNRSNFDPTTGTPDLVDSPFGERPNWREQVNSVTSYLDASQVYGSDDERAAALRTFEGGKLKVSEDGLLPLNSPGLQNDDPFGLGESLYLAGDVRANEQVGLTAVHTMFVREHNRLADLIAAEDPTLSDEEIYQWARKIVNAEIQIITYDEYLPALLGDSAPSASAAEYDETVDASITNSFATAIFRFGHSMQSSELQLVDDAGNSVGSLSLAEAFFDPSILGDNPENVDLVLKGLASQVAQENDVQLVDDIRKFLFGPPGAGGLDLAALDIQRGRDHGLPDYNSLREFYGLERVTSFAEITSDPEIQAKLEELYGDIDSIDAFVGAIAEDHLAGSSVGALIDAVTVNQFERLRDGDRFFYANDPALRTSLVRNVIDLKNVTLAGVIQQTTGVTNIQDNVFFDASVLHYNAKGKSADVTVVAGEETISLLDRRGRVLESRPIDEVSHVILVGTDSRRGDRFVLGDSFTALSLAIGVTIQGGDGRRDVLAVLGGENVDMAIGDGNVLTVNGTQIELDGIERLELDLGDDEDEVQIVDESDLEVIIMDGHP